jgi:hypothetical protein
MIEVFYQIKEADNNIYWYRQVYNDGMKRNTYANMYMYRCYYAIEVVDTQYRILKANMLRNFELTLDPMLDSFAKELTLIRLQATTV